MFYLQVPLLLQTQLPLFLLMHIGHRSLSVKNQKYRKCRTRADSSTRLVRNLVICKNSHFMQIILVVRLLDLEISSRFCEHTNLLGISQMLKSGRLCFVGYELVLLCCSLRDVGIYKAKYKTLIIICFVLICWCTGRRDRTRKPSNFSMFLGWYWGKNHKPCLARHFLILGTFFPQRL